MKKQVPFIIITIHLLLITACSPSPLPETEMTVETVEYPDMMDTGYCGIAVLIRVWDDINENMHWDDGEVPLKGVRFLINGKETGVDGKPFVSDWEGKVDVSLEKDDCISTLRIEALSMEGYIFISRPIVELQRNLSPGRNHVYFALSRESVYPESAQYSYFPEFQCYHNPTGVEDIQSEPDGTIRAVTRTRGAVTLNAYDEWEANPAFFEGEDPFTPDLFLPVDGQVWLVEQESGEEQDQDVWGLRSLEDQGFVSGVNTPDGAGVWFRVPPELPGQYKLAHYHSKLKVWTLYGVESLQNSPYLSATLYHAGSSWMAHFEQPGRPVVEDLHPAWSFQEKHAFSKGEYRTTYRLGDISDLEIDRDGNLWIADTSGVRKIIPGSYKMLTYEPDFPTGNIAATDIEVGLDGDIWVIYPFRKFHLARLIPIDDEYGFWRSYSALDGLLEGEVSNALTVDGEGNIWLGYSDADQTLRCSPVQ